jgi:RNA polymerase sigma-70 factor (ECF subfamily)
MEETTVEQFLKAYDDHSDAIYRHCFFRVFSKPQAEELVQEAFMRTWGYLQDGKRVDNIRAFLYRVANNLIIDQSRKKREESLEAVLENAPGLEPVMDNTVEADTERNALMQDILRVVEDLPEEDRRLITLRYVDELETGEIAKILDISSNHASVKLSRAMKALRELLKSDDGVTNE